MIFRDYSSKDFEELQQLWEDLGMGGRERGDSDVVILRTLDSGGKLIILEDEVNRVIAGSCWMTSDARRLYLHHFGIRKEYQEKGWGYKLAKQSLAFIKETGLQVKLEVHKENHAAKALYEKSGFFAFRDYDIYMIREARNIIIEE